MTELESVDSLYEEGLKRYQAGEKAEDLLPIFQEICDRAPKMSAAWTSLSWLYLLADKPKSALKAAQKSIKIDHNDPQGRINLALAMLATQQKGVRQHVELAKQLMSLDSQVEEEIIRNLKEGSQRKPDWKEIEKVRKWLSV
jgi:predicted Zn-dependent protease